MGINSGSGSGNTVCLFVSSGGRLNLQGLTGVVFERTLARSEMGREGTGFPFLGRGWVGGRERMREG